MWLTSVSIGESPQGRRQIAKMPKRFSYVGFVSDSIQPAYACAAATEVFCWGCAICTIKATHDSAVRR